jgi:ribosome-associated protein
LEAAARQRLGYHNKRAADAALARPTMPRPHPSPDVLPDAAPVSKTRRKRDMEALLALGERLVALDAARLASLDLPERLTDAVALARRTTRHEARRRQMQYIGRLMRDIDSAPLEAAFARWSEGPAQERAQFAALERWRTRLMDDDAALDAFVAAHPQVDRAALARLVAEAREERQCGGPPHHQRALFRALKTAQHAHD